MRCRNSRFEMDLARPEDGAEILEILEEKPFEGQVSLLYTRRPDPYASFKQEGAHVDVVVCRDLERSRVVAMGAYAIRPLFVNGKVEQVAYLMGLRSRTDSGGASRRLLHRAYGFLHAHSETQRPAFYFTTILEENTHARRLLEKRRKIMPAYEPFGRYETFALRPVRGPKAIPGLQFRKAQREDLSALITFLNERGQRHQFFPVMQEADLLQGTYCGLRLEDFYLLVGPQDVILAAGAAWDQQRYKQYVVQQYGGWLRLCQPVFFTFPLFGLPRLPRQGAALRFFTLSFWAMRTGDPEIFSYFLDRVSAHLQQYPFFLVGVHERNPFRPVLNNRPHVTYASRLYLVDWEKKQNPVDRLETDRVPYLECGML